MERKAKEARELDDALQAAAEACGGRERSSLDSGGARRGSGGRRQSGDQAAAAAAAAGLGTGTGAAAAAAAAAEDGRKGSGDAAATLGSAAAAAVASNAAVGDTGGGDCTRRRICAPPGAQQDGDATAVSIVGDTTAATVAGTAAAPVAALQSVLDGSAGPHAGDAPGDAAAAFPTPSKRQQQQQQQQQQQLPTGRLIRHSRHKSSPELSPSHPPPWLNPPPPHLPSVTSGVSTDPSPLGPAAAAAAPYLLGYDRPGSGGGTASPAAALQRGAGAPAMHAVVSLQDLSFMGEPEWLHRPTEPERSQADVSAWLETVPSTLPLSGRNTDADGSLVPTPSAAAAAAALTGQQAGGDGHTGNGFAFVQPGGVQRADPPTATMPIWSVNAAATTAIAAAPSPAREPKHVDHQPLQQQQQQHQGRHRSQLLVDPFATPAVQAMVIESPSPLHHQEQPAATQPPPSIQPPAQQPEPSLSAAHTHSHVHGMGQQQQQQQQQQRRQQSIQRRARGTAAQGTAPPPPPPPAAAAAGGVTPARALAQQPSIGAAGAGMSDVMHSDRGTVRDWTAVEVAIHANTPADLGAEERRELRAQMDERCEELLFALHKATNAMTEALKQAESELFLGERDPTICRIACVPCCML